MITSSNEKITAWHVTITEHQIYPYLEIHRQFQGMENINVFKKKDFIRENQGWTSPSQSEVKVNYFLGFIGFIKAVHYLYTHRGSVHVFGSVFERMTIFLIFLVSCILVRKTYLISEPFADVPMAYFSNSNKLLERIKVFMRPVVYKCAVSLFRKKVTGVLAISEKARTQYEKSGMSSDKIFRYGYFIPNQIESHQLGAKLGSQSTMRLIFIGNIIPRKGVELLIKAVTDIRQAGFLVELDLYGSKMENSIELDFDGINYKGTIPFGTAESVCIDYHALILPSFYDGWGVVVNEAINAGIAVICSSAVGAKLLVEEFNVGIVFDSGRADLLRDAILEIRGQMKNGFPRTQNIFEAQDAIRPSRAGRYMWDLFTDNFKGDFFSKRDGSDGN